MVVRNSKKKMICAKTATETNKAHCNLSAKYRKKGIVYNTYCFPLFNYFLTTPKEQYSYGVDLKPFIKKNTWEKKYKKTLKTKKLLELPNGKKRNKSFTFNESYFMLFLFNEFIGYLAKPLQKKVESLLKEFHNYQPQTDAYGNQICMDKQAYNSLCLINAKCKLSGIANLTQRMEELNQLRFQGRKNEEPLSLKNISNQSKHSYFLYDTTRLFVGHKKDMLCEDKPWNETKDLHIPHLLSKIIMDKDKLTKARRNELQERIKFILLKELKAEENKNFPEIFKQFEADFKTLINLAQNKAICDIFDEIISKWAEDFYKFLEPINSENFCQPDPRQNFKILPKGYWKRKKFEDYIQRFNVLPECKKQLNESILLQLQDLCCLIVNHGWLK